MTNILLIEDSIDDVFVFKRAARKAGFDLDIRVAGDGVQAIELLQNLGLTPESSAGGWWPDLVLMDLRLPGIGGLEILDWIRKRAFTPALNVVVLTSSVAPTDIEGALKAGAHSFILKPSNSAELLARVRPFLPLGPSMTRLEDFAAGSDEGLCALAHNLKSMAGGILMNAEILHGRVKGQKPACIEELAENILQSSSRMLRFVRQFLANSAADHGLALKLEPVNLANVVAQIVQDYQEIAKRKNITMHLVLAENNAFIRADSGALYQVLDNLVSNALKFSPLGKEIVLSLYPAGHLVEFSVQDQGPGFTPEDERRMFTRFSRLSATPTAGEPSTGLGLSIVKKMTLAMGGSVNCESSPGRGALFQVRFPRQSATRPEGG